MMSTQAILTQAAATEHTETSHAAATEHSSLPELNAYNKQQRRPRSIASIPETSIAVEPTVTNAEGEESDAEQPASNFEAPSASIRRQALDGKWYDYQSFLDWYGVATAPRAWTEAMELKTFQNSTPSAYELMLAAENGCPVLATSMEGAAFNSYMERGESLQAERLAAKESFDTARAVWV